MKKLFLILSICCMGLGGAMPSVGQDAMPSPEASQMININTADAQTLSAVMSGVDTARAQAIVSYREEHGPFDSVQALLEVDGVGPTILANNQHLLRVE
jgi:competence protein ComEA